MISFEAMCDRLARTCAGVPEAPALAEIERATMLARAETADAWRAAGRLPALPEQTTPRAGKLTKPVTKAANKTDIKGNSQAAKPAGPAERAAHLAKTRPAD